MDHKRYWVYIVASNSGTLYIGVTSRLYFRVMEHKTGTIEGFSSKYKCTRLVYFESFDIVQKAIGREKQLKGWRRSKKIALIESVNPRWEDFAEKWGSEMAFAGQALVHSDMTVSFNVLVGKALAARLQFALTRAFFSRKRCCMRRSPSGEPSCHEPNQ